MPTPDNISKQDNDGYARDYCGGTNTNWSPPDGSMWTPAKGGAPMDHPATKGGNQGDMRSG